MQLSIHTRHYELTPAIKRYVIETLQEPVEGIWQKDGARLEVYLSDIRGGTKSGLDQECRCTLHVPLGPRLVITEISDDMRTSIHLARRRLMRRLRAYISRRTVTARRPRKQYFARTADTQLATRPVRSEEIRGGRETAG